MLEIISDNLELVNKIKKKELKYQDLEEIVSIYNKSQE